MYNFKKYNIILYFPVQVHVVYIYNRACNFYATDNDRVLTNAIHDEVR